MACHLASFSGYLIPFGNIIGPLIVWLVYRERFPFVDDQGKESLNFQITSMIAIFVAGVSFCIGIGVVLLPIVLVAEIILTIIAAVKASQGIAYRYPLTIRFIS